METVSMNILSKILVLKERRKTINWDDYTIKDRVLGARHGGPSYLGGEVGESWFQDWHRPEQKRETLSECQINSKRTGGGGVRLKWSNTFLASKRHWVQSPQKKRGNFFVCLFKIQEFVSGNKDNNIKAKKKKKLRSKILLFGI
jgi:hypothetical protein